MRTFTAASAAIVVASIAQSAIAADSGRGALKVLDVSARVQIAQADDAAARDPARSPGFVDEMDGFRLVQDGGANAAPDGLAGFVPAELKDPNVRD